MRAAEEEAIPEGPVKLRRFGPPYCSLAAAGEASGALDTILQRQAHYLKTLQELQGRVTLALIYSAFLMFSGVIVSVLFVTKLIPQLTALLETTPGAKMPIGAVILIAISAFVKKWWLVMLLLIGEGAVLFNAWKDSEANKPRWHRIQPKLPLYGRVVEQRFFVQFLDRTDDNHRSRHPPPRAWMRRVAARARERSMSRAVRCSRSELRSASTTSK